MVQYHTCGVESEDAFLSRNAFCVSFRDRLALRLVYSKAFPTAGQITELLQDVLADLFKQLQLMMLSFRDFFLCLLDFGNDYIVRYIYTIFVPPKD